MTGDGSVVVENRKGGSRHLRSSERGNYNRPNSLVADRGSAAAFKSYRTKPELRNFVVAFNVNVRCLISITA